MPERTGQGWCCMRTERLRIVSRSSRPFHDRREAGQLLAREISNLRGAGTVVLGIPRGGIVVADELARELDAALDIIIARKMRAPGYPELAIGAVAEDGNVFLNEMLVAELGIDKDYIEGERINQMEEIGQRARLVRRVLPKIDLQGKTVIVTDDGVATGATTLASIWAARREKPAKLVTAIPVGAEHTLVSLARDVDEMVALRAPPDFMAVGQFYSRFQQVTDEEVLAILEGEDRRRSSP